VDITQNTAHLSFVASSGSLTCADTYLIADRQGFYFRIIYEAGSHTCTLASNFQPLILTIWAAEIQGLSASEIAEINAHGLHVFVLPDGIVGSIEDIFATLLLFVGPWQEQDNRKFLQDHWHYTFTPRKNLITPIDKSKLRSGDYLAIRTWVGSDPLIMVRLSFTSLLGSLPHPVLKAWNWIPYWPHSHGNGSR